MLSRTNPNSYSAHSHSPNSHDSISSLQSNSSTPKKSKSSQNQNQNQNQNVDADQHQHHQPPPSTSTPSPSNSPPSSFKASVLSRVNPAFLSRSDHSSSPKKRYFHSSQSQSQSQSQLENENENENGASQDEGIRSPTFAPSPSSLRGNAPLPIPSRSSSVVSPISNSTSSPMDSSFPKRTSSIQNPVLHSDTDPEESTEMLADSIARLRLGHREGQEEQEPDLSSSSISISFDKSSTTHQSEPATFSLETLTDSLEEINSLIHEIQSEIFQIEEKRHASSSNHDQDRDDQAQNGENIKRNNQQDLALMEISAKIETCSKKMNTSETGLKQLEQRTEEEEEEEEGEGEDSETAFSERNPSRDHKTRRNSLTSLSSFDEEFQPRSTSRKDLKTLKGEFQEVSSKWLETQTLFSTLEQELIEDKKESSFHSQSKQIVSMLDSLEKGFLAGNDFVKSFKESSNIRKEYEEEEDGHQSKLEEFVKLKKSIEAKKLYYHPAIEQMFGILERNLKGRMTANGIILSHYSDLKNRWNFLKENVRKVLRELDIIEKKFNGHGNDHIEGIQESNPSPLRNNGGSNSNSSTPNRPILRPKHSTRNLGSNSTSGGSTTGSSAPVSPVSNSSILASPPPKPPKSLRRTSMILNESNSSPSSPSVSRALRSKISQSNFNPGTSLPASSHGNGFGNRHVRSASTSTHQNQSSLSPDQRTGLTSGAFRGGNPPISSPFKNSPSSRPAWNNSIKIERDRNALLEQERERERERERKTSTNSNSYSSPSYSYSANHYQNPDNSLESIGSNSFSTHSDYTNRRRPSFNEVSSGMGISSGSGSGRTTPNQSASFAPSSYSYSNRNPSNLGVERPGIVLNDGRMASRSKTPQPQPTWTTGSYRAGSEPPVPVRGESARSTSRNGNRPSSRTEVRPSSRTEMRPSSRTEIRSNYRPASSTGHYNSPSYSSRPASMVGNYYHPPQSNHENEIGKSPNKSKRDSLIPRLAFPSNHQHSDQSTQRPGSSLSQSSNTTAYDNHHTPPVTSRYSGASRLSMQTPEPMIAARVNRMSMYARPSGKASSKPPISHPSSRLGGSSNNTSPLNIRKLNGRTTPLNAEALEKIPNASPQIQSGSSVANFRAQRAGAGGAGGAGGGGASTNTNQQFGGREGAMTPNYSEGGNSSIGGFSNSTFNQFGRGHHTGAGNGYEFYKPNPNDSLDLAVAKIVNELGARCERIDLPLPRGQKLELGPGKSAQARYEIAGKKVACRMLELHRPAGSAGSQAGVNTRKISVRVGGGYQDLKLWLYDRMSLE